MSDYKLSEQYFNQSINESFKYQDDLMDRSMLSQDQNAVRKFIQQQPEYFVSEDVRNIQQLCNKKEMSIHSEENEKSKRQIDQKKIVIQLQDTRGINQKNMQTFEKNQNEDNNKDNLYFLKQNNILNPILSGKDNQQDNSNYNLNIADQTSKDIQLSPAFRQDDQSISQIDIQSKQDGNVKHKTSKKDHFNTLVDSSEQKQYFNRNSNEKIKKLGMVLSQELLQQPATNILRTLLIKIHKKMKMFYQQRTSLGRGKNISNKARNLINDFSDISSDTKQTNIIFSAFKYIFNYIIIFLQFIKADKIPLFNPENPLKIIFNTATASFTCSYLYITSMIIFFQADFGHSYHYLHQVAQTIWVFEMIVQMNTAMYHDNQFTTDRKTIVKCYFKEYLFFEMIPLIFENQSSSDIKINIFLKIPLLLKIKGISINLDQLEFYILQILKNHIILSLIKLILQMILLGHILSCFWSLVCYYEIYINDQQIIWSFPKETFENLWQERYLIGLYWSYTIMTNSQIYRPSTNLELLFTCFGILISCISFGYLLSSIGNILYEINKENKEYNKDLNILSKYMKRKQIQLSIVRRANVSLREYYLHQQEVNFQEERQAIFKLNEYMREELLVSSNEQFLSQFSFLSQVFSKKSLKQIQTQMQEVLYAPNQVIFDQSQRIQEEQFLYFITKGQSKIYLCIKYVINQNLLYYKVKLVDSKESNQDKNQQNENLNNIDETSQSYYNFGLKPFNTNIEIFINLISFEQRMQINEQINNNLNSQDDIGRIISQGQCFGFHGFFTGNEIIKISQSVGFTSVLKISRSSVLQIIKKQKKDIEIFKQIADQITFDKHLSILGIKCQHCNSLEHESKNCFQIHFDKENPYIILKFNYSPQQKRSKIIRRKNATIKYNAFKNNKQVTEKIYQFREHNGYSYYGEQMKQSNISFQDIQLSKKQISSQIPISKYDIQSIKFIDENKQIEDITPKDLIRKDSSQSIASILQIDDLKEKNHSHQFKNNIRDEIISPIDFSKGTVYSKNLYEGFNSNYGENDMIEENEINRINQSSERHTQNYNLANKNSLLNSQKFAKLQQEIQFMDRSSLIAKQQQEHQYMDRSSYINQLLPQSQSQMQLAKEFSQKQRSVLQINKHDNSLNSNAQSLLLPIQNILKNINFSPEIEKANFNFHQNVNSYADQLQGLLLDKLQNYDYYFRYYNSNNVISRFKQLQQNKYSIKKSKKSSKKATRVYSPNKDG